MVIGPWSRLWSVTFKLASPTLILFIIIHLEIPRTNIRNSLGSQRERIGGDSFNVKTHNKIAQWTRLASTFLYSNTTNCIEGLLSHYLVTDLTNSFPISSRDPPSIHSLASVDDERKPLEVVRVNGCAD